MEKEQKLARIKEIEQQIGDNKEDKRRLEEILMLLNNLDFIGDAIREFLIERCALNIESLGIGGREDLLDHLKAVVKKHSS